MNEYSLARSDIVYEVLFHWGVLATDLISLKTFLCIKCLLQ